MDEFREMVAKNAYYRAEKRNFESGHELEDWFEAEREISAQRDRRASCRERVSSPV